MSDTDDTDVLLLIPPNFFLVQSSGSEDSLLDSSRTVVHKPPSCTAQVLGKLVNQVHILENRLGSLELSTTTESVSSRAALSRRQTWVVSESLNSSNTKYFTFPRRRRRKTLSYRQKHRDLSFTSLDSASTYEKYIPSLKLSDTVLKSELVDDSPSMDGDLSSIVSTPSKKNDKLLLHEIDEFLTKVETYESPDSKCNRPDVDYSPENVIKAAGDYISHKLDSKEGFEEVKLPSGRVVPSSILDKYIYLVQNNQNTNKPPSSCKPEHSNEPATEETIPKLTDKLPTAHEPTSPSVRKLNFSDTNKEVQPTSTPKKTTTSYLNTFTPSSNKIYERASKVLEQYKAQNSSHNNQTTLNTNCDTTKTTTTSLRRDDFRVPQRPSNLDHSAPQRPNLDTKEGHRSYNFEMREGPKLNPLQTKFMDTIDTDLLSLSDLWGEKKETNGMERGESSKLEEERMKREHCEATIQDLQKKILKQQQQLAVALKVDRSKDSAIARLKEAWLRLTGSLERAEARHRAALDNMTREVDNFRTGAEDAQKKTNHFEAELYKALDLAHDYQDKCKQLEHEKRELQDTAERALASKEEAVNTKAQEVQVLKENCDTMMRLNKQSADCVRNVEEALQKEKQEHDNTKLKLAAVIQAAQSTSEELSILGQERDMLKEKVNEERARCNMIERQLAEKQNQTSELLKRCDTLDDEVKSLRQQQDIQRSELKCHYQSQLEEAVLAKLREFQIQLDQAEREMENEWRSKENAIVDTFNKQMARIEDQHKLEINVLEAKHKEENKLYRLQLAQAGEKVGALESRVESHRRRRARLAADLHGVMEAQWRAARDILTHGAGAARDRPDDTRDTILSTPEPAPPNLRPRAAPPAPTAAAARGLEDLSDSELQHYVKLFLSKPADLPRGPPPPPPGTPYPPAAAAAAGAPRPADDSLEEPTSDRADRADRADRRRAAPHHKPPWKA